MHKCQFVCNRQLRVYQAFLIAVHIAYISSNKIENVEIEMKLFSLPGADNPCFYVRASTLCCFHIVPKPFGER